MVSKGPEIMPKYNPTEQDMFSTKPCAICGRDVVDDDKETCCSLCEQQWQSFKEDFETLNSAWWDDVEE